MTWVLLIVAYSKGVALHSVPGFRSLEECAMAGRSAVEVLGTGLGTPYVKTTCVAQTGAKP